MNPSLNEYYGKSIRIAPDGFSFYKQDGKRLVSKSFPNDSCALVSTEAPQFFAPDEPLTVVAAWHVPILVPSELYDPAKGRDYLSLQFDISRLGKSFADEIGAYTAVYSLTQNKLDALSRLSNPQQIVSETTLAFRMLRDLDATSAIFIGHNEGFIDVAAAHKGEPLLANRFQLTEPSDILYYLLNIVKQLNLRSPELLLHFFGNEDRKLLQLLKSYKIKPVIL